jgi:hypothetical protein
MHSLAHRLKPGEGVESPHFLMALVVMVERRGLSGLQPRWGSMNQAPVQRVHLGRGPGGQPDDSWDNNYCGVIGCN